MSILLSTPASCEQQLTNARLEAETLRHWLTSGQLVNLDQRINQAQQDYEKGKLDEWGVNELFSALAVPDPAFEEILIAWSDAVPNSYAAQVAIGVYYAAVGNEWRGSRYISETHPEQIQRMRQYHQKAETHLTAALKLTEKPINAYVGLIALSGMQGQRNNAETWLQQALIVAPNNYGVRAKYMGMLEPRWGGSYEAMQTFSEQARSALSPAEADKLTSRILLDKAKSLWSAGDNVAALDTLNRALETTNTVALRLTRAKLYHTLGRLNEAWVDIEQASSLDPDDADILEERSHIQFTRQRVAEGMADLQAAAARWNTSAMHKLGDAYAEGTHGLTIQPETGLEWIRKSAHYWNSAAMFWLGVSYYKGIGLKEDHAKAFWYFERAAAQNHIPAMNELGLMYWYGQGTEPDQQAAAELWLEIAREGEWRGKHNLHYFLSSKERLLLLLDHPEDYALLIDEQITYRAIGALAVLMLLGGWLAYRLNRAHQSPQNAHGNYHGMPARPMNRHKDS